MSIAILGAGAMAKGLAALFAKAGYNVVVGARDVAKAQAAAASAGHGARGDSIAAAAKSADFVVLAVPFAAAADTLAAAGDLSGKAIIDITNPLTADYMGLTIGHSTSAGEEIQKLAPKAKVVKAFNTIFAQVLANGGKAAGRTTTVFVAGDDASANGAVEAIARKAGFDVVQTGGLKLARYLEPLAGLNVVLAYGRGLGADIAPTWNFSAAKAA
jgi:predicted dinucleotide-binding enzyme